MNFLIIFGMLIVLMMIFVASSYLNQKVEVPENCKAAYLEAQACDTCGNHSESGSKCGFQGALEFMKEIKL
jgi:hypothetical protein